MRRTSACFVPGSNPVGRRTLTLPCARSSGSTQATGANALPAEAGSPALPGLRGRGPCIAERLHDFVGEIPLRGRKARLIVPAQPSADGHASSSRARDLVGAPMQLPYLLTAGSGTHLVVDRHRAANTTGEPQKRALAERIRSRHVFANRFRVAPPGRLPRSSHPIRGEGLDTRTAWLTAIARRGEVTNAVAVAASGGLRIGSGTPPVR